MLGKEREIEGGECQRREIGHSFQGEGEGCGKQRVLVLDDISVERSCLGYEKRWPPIANERRHEVC